MKYFLFVPFLVVFAAFMISCKGNDGVQGPAGPSLTGTITGYVYLADQNDSLLTVRGGVTISIGGTNIIAVSDSTGKWTLNGVQTGTYQITFSKSGFDSFIIPSQQFIGGGTFTEPDIYLVQRQASYVTNETVKDSLYQYYNENELYLTDYVSQPTYAFDKKYVVFICTSPSVSSDPATYVYDFSSPQNTNQSFHIWFSKQRLNAEGFTSGSTIYLVSYAASQYSVTYRDTATGRSYYTGLSATPSNVVSAVVP